MGNQKAMEVTVNDVRDSYSNKIKEKIKELFLNLQKHENDLQFIKRDSLKLIMFGGLGYFWAKGEILHLFNPLGLAYLSLFFGEGIFFYTVLISITLGGLTMSPLKVGAIFMSSLAIQIIFGKDIKRDNKEKKAILAGFTMLISGVFYGFSQRGLAFYFVVAGVETVLAVIISYLAQKGTSIIWDRDENTIITKEEILGFIFLFSGAFVGISNIESIYISEGIISFLAGYIIAIACKSEGMNGGATTGLIIGFLLYLCGGVSIEIFALFGIAGLLGGAVKDLGRISIAMVIISLPMLIMFYQNRDAFNIVWLQGWILANLVFLITPNKILSVFQGQVFLHEKSKNIYLKKKKLLEDKLVDLSKAFYVLSKTFKSPIEIEDKKEIVKLVDRIAESSCSGCGMAHYCWEEDLYKSYSMTVSALSICDDKGKVVLNDMPEDFKVNCAYTEKFISQVNRIYYDYRKDKVWISRLEECRDLVGQQMEAVGELLKDLSEDLDDNCNFLDNISYSLKTVMAKNKINVYNCQVIENIDNGRLKIELNVKGCDCNGDCQKKYLNIIKDTVGRSVELSKKNMCHCNNKGECKLVYKEIPSFNLTTATMSSSANVDISGDTTGFLQTEDGISIMAISDGMGQGVKASNESLTAIELLEQFSEAGFSRELAVKMINSALLLRRESDSYATLDICAVDLFSGKCQFIKLGAVSSYIYRNERILTITSHTLPAGIMGEVEVIESEMDLKDGDIIIMLTDGITEILEGESNTANWLKKRLKEKPMSNPEDIAIAIMQGTKNNKKRDDMTVMVGRFWKKR